jgi:hypothetical protein
LRTALRLAKLLNLFASAIILKQKEDDSENKVIANKKKRFLKLCASL